MDKNPRFNNLFGLLLPIIPAACKSDENRSFVLMIYSTWRINPAEEQQRLRRAVAKATL